MLRAPRLRSPVDGLRLAGLRDAAPGEATSGGLHRARDRTGFAPDSDRALDPGRRPAELLAFLGVRSGNRVAELGAGGGYTTELLARAVGPKGVVYAQNSAALLAFANESWTRRLARPSMARVVRLDREFESPLPPEVTVFSIPS